MRVMAPVGSGECAGPRKQVRRMLAHRRHDLRDARVYRRRGPQDPSGYHPLVA